MFVKLVVFTLFVVMSTAVYNGPLAGGLPAAQYPAGVDPQACPNYPNCENPAVAVNQIPIHSYNAAAAPQHYNPIPVQPQYNAIPQYNAAPRSQYPSNIQSALDRGEYIGDGDYHGEGLPESQDPGYHNGYNGAPVYNPFAYNPAASGAHHNPNVAYSHSGLPQPAQVPAGVDARSCPNYPFCH